MNDSNFVPHVLTFESRVSVSSLRNLRHVSQTEGFEIFLKSPHKAFSIRFSTSRTWDFFFLNKISNLRFKCLKFLMLEDLNHYLSGEKFFSPNFGDKFFDGGEGRSNREKNFSNIPPSPTIVLPRFRRLHSLLQFSNLKLWVGRWSIKAHNFFST